MHELIGALIALAACTPLILVLLRDKKQLREERDRKDQELQQIREKLHPVLRQEKPVTAAQIVQAGRERRKAEQPQEGAGSFRKGGWAATKQKLEFITDTDRQIETVLKAHEGVAI